MVVFPLVAAIVSALCGLVIARDAWRRTSADKIAWIIAFALFALAASMEVFGSISGWTELSARLYYVSGAVLVVGFLALGELYLLAGNRLTRFAPGVALLVSVVAVTLVWEAPIDAARLADDGWDALERGPALVAMAVIINALGTIVLAGGAGYSGWRFHQRGTHRNRMIGCALIALGTLVVAMGGTLTRFGQHEYLYIAMSVGVVIIFAGILQTRRTDAAGLLQPVRPTVSLATDRNLLRLPNRGRTVSAQHGDPGIAYIEQVLVPLDLPDLKNALDRWSATPRDIDRFDRQQAKDVWQMRLQLTAENQPRFDALPLSQQLQITELWQNVFLSDANRA